MTGTYLSLINPENNLLKEKHSGASFIGFNDAGDDTYRVKQSFTLDKDEHVYGLGILQNGKMSQRNQSKYLIQGNVEDVTTFFHSIKGYGIFWDNYSPTNLLIVRMKRLSSRKWETALIITLCMEVTLTE